MSGMKVFGLVGFPLEHSWSPEWFNAKFRKEQKPDCEYRLFPLKKIEDFGQLLEAEPLLSGLNITIPYKEQIIPLLDETDPAARAIGAVNTIVVTRAGSSIHTKGYNTDAQGFAQTLDELPFHQNALILGSGGASKAVSFVLKSRKTAFKIVSRDRQDAGLIRYEALDREIIRKHSLIINTSPVGMFPDVNGFPPVPYHFLTRNHCLYDLIYNPAETVFLRKGRESGAFTINGYQMLVNQAQLAYSLFMISG